MYLAAFERGGAHLGTLYRGVQGLGNLGAVVGSDEWTMPGGGPIGWWKPAVKAGIGLQALNQITGYFRGQALYTGIGRNAKSFIENKIALLKLLPSQALYRTPTGDTAGGKLTVVNTAYFLMAPEQWSKLEAAWAAWVPGERDLWFNKAGQSGWQQDEMTKMRFAHLNTLKPEQRAVLDAGTRFLIQQGKDNPPWKGTSFTFQYAGKSWNAQWVYALQYAGYGGAWNDAGARSWVLLVNNLPWGVRTFTPARDSQIIPGVPDVFFPLIAATAVMTVGLSVAAIGSAVAASAAASGAVIPSTVAPGVLEVVAESGAPSLLQVAPVAAPLVESTPGWLAQAATYGATAAKVGSVAATLYKTEQMIQGVVSPAKPSSVSLPRPAAQAAPPALTEAGAGVGIGAVTIGGLALLFLLNR